MLEPALAKNSCQPARRTVADISVHVFNGRRPQSLVVVPEAGEKVPHKKAEIEFLRVEMLEHCALPPLQHERIDRESQSITPSIIPGLHRCAVEGTRECAFRSKSSIEDFEAVLAEFFDVAAFTPWMRMATSWSVDISV